MGQKKNPKMFSLFKLGLVRDSALNLPYTNLTSRDRHE